MCFVGKATKIFLYLVTVLVMTGLILGFGLLRHGIHLTHKCSDDSCHQPPVVFTNPNPGSTTTTTTTTPYPTPSYNPNSNPLPPPPPSVVVTTAPTPSFSPPIPVVSPSPV
ncbi:hypothetical protein U1Q18_024521 [Sarracenia purpurea var. burkii]